jgi:membrane protein DedA with SNARE-associated domain
MLIFIICAIIWLFFGYLAGRIIVWDLEDYESLSLIAFFFLLGLLGFVIAALMCPEYFTSRIQIIGPSENTKRNVRRFFGGK